MNFKSLVSENLPEIKKLLFAEQEEAAPSEDAKLSDGTIVRFSPALEVGASAELISEDGTTVSVPDAEHEMDNGTIFRTEAGMVVEITEAPEQAPEAEPVEEAMETAKTTDGISLTADPDFSVGAMVSINNEDGSTTPAEGSYTLEDGRVCVVEAGVIVEVTEAPEEKVEEAPSEEAMRVAMAKYAKHMNFATQGSIDERFTQMEKGIELLTDIVGKLAALPKEEAKKPVANPFGKGKSADELVEKMRKALKK